jgi:hypothetical protein
MTTIADAARTIAKTDPPGWLVPALDHFSHYLQTTGDPDDLEIEKNMLKAAKYLDFWLPIYIRLGEPPWNFDIPDDFETVHTGLYEVIGTLEHDINAVPHRAGGPKPDIRKPVCAAVAGEAYRLLHGELEPYSAHLQQGCEDYWGVTRCSKSSNQLL